MKLREEIFKLLENLPNQELPNAIGFLNERHIAPLYYRYLFYNPLSEREISEFIEECHFYITEPLINIYKNFNGLRVNQRLSIYGSLLNKGFQPISLNYGNLNERPNGLPKNSTVIGSLMLSDENYGYLVVKDNGIVTCTSTPMDYDDIQSWPDIETLIKNEILSSL